MTTPDYPTTETIARIMATGYNRHVSDHGPGGSYASETMESRDGPGVHLPFAGDAGGEHRAAVQPAAGGRDREQQCRYHRPDGPVRHLRPIRVHRDLRDLRELLRCQVPRVLGGRCHDRHVGRSEE